jgi:hypothetical protein
MRRRSYDVLHSRPESSQSGGRVSIRGGGTRVSVVVHSVSLHLVKHHN